LVARARSVRLVWAAAGLAAALALSSDALTPRLAAAEPDPLRDLKAYEAKLRLAADFEMRPSSEGAFGPDPYRLAALADGRFVGLLRGRDQVLLLSSDLKELARTRAPRAPSGITLSEDSTIWVVGELSPRVRGYRVAESGLTEVSSLTVPGALSLRAIDHGPRGVLYIADAVTGRLLSLSAQGELLASAHGGAGLFDVRRVGAVVLTNSLLEHRVSLFRTRDDGAVDGAPYAQIEHDGPIWSMDALELEGERLLVLGGVEDRPLDRSQGFFGHLDSFIYLYRDPGDGRIEALARINVSALGVVTPKAVGVTRRGQRLTVDVTGYGGPMRAELDFALEDLRAAPTSRAFPLPPGTASWARSQTGWVLANPLLDAFGQLEGREPSLVRITDAHSQARSDESRLGEALLFTTLMAPHNSSEGALSRFTCETCHFEAGTDGRTHHTGRRDVHATTKPLRGLFENRPYFSRAHDKNLAEMVHAEFRVAGKGSGADPWFALTASEAPWLQLTATRYSPLELRRALLTFLAELSHRPNPRIIGRTHFSHLERAGQTIFAQRCERCHQARLASDREDLRVPVARWESLVLKSSGPLVWGRVGHEKTGVMPYVDSRGARVPSLRRLDIKRPYFTNGSAKALTDVLRRARFNAAHFYHAPPEPDPPATLQALAPGEQQALLAFLQLL
jgi:hypothetical protein